MRNRPLASDFDFDVNKWYYFVTYKPEQKLILEIRVPKGASVTDKNRVKWVNFLGDKGTLVLFYDKEAPGRFRHHPDWSHPDTSAKILNLIDGCFCDCGRGLGPLCRECLQTLTLDAAVNYVELEQLPTERLRGF